MYTDPIADLLTRVRNAGMARHRKVDVPSSQVKLSIVDIWKKQGFIRDFRLYRQGQKGVLRIFLKYASKGTPVIRGVQRVSRPSRRVYMPHDRIPKVHGGMGMSVISTSKGIVTDQMARDNRVGGEILCTIW